MPSRKILLDEEEIPKQWYNILPDLPKPLSPIINPATREPVKPEEIAPLFPMECLKQEMSQERWINIPEEVRDVYRSWRPTPLYRATKLEKALKTPAKIYYKYEGVSPPGSHKPNTAVAQAYYNRKEGIQRLATETGAGQWGSALAFGCMLFGVDCTVYMVKISYDQKPYRRVMMETWGASVYPGSLGIAISEAVEDAVTHDDTKYAIGSVLNHVLLHQTVVGLETQKQLESVGDYPDVVTGCIGGGSSFSGLFWPFYYDKVSKKAPKNAEFIAVESTACPSVTKGYYMYDHGDTARLIPLVKMHTLGHMFIPAPIHAGGLRYHGMAPTLCLLNEEGTVETRAYNQVQAFEAGALFARTEGIIPKKKVEESMRKLMELYPWIKNM